MPRLVNVGAEYGAATTAPRAESNGAVRSRKKPASEPANTPNALGGMVFRDRDAVASDDVQAAFLMQLLERYPDAAKPKIDSSLHSLVVQVDGLESDPNNAVSHPEPNMRAIMESFAAFGQRKPIVVRAENMRVMAGNGSLEAVKRLKWPVVAAAVQSMSDAEAAAYGMADNRTSDMHKWDKKKVQFLDALIADAADDRVRTVGWSSSELRELRKWIPPSTMPVLTNQVYKVIVECNGEQQQIELLRELETRGIKCQALIS